MRKLGYALLMSAAAAGGLLAMLPAQAKDTSFALIERGRHLVNAGDCAACHTAKEGKPFAGGRAVVTPFGTIYSTNITPDRETGLGGWSDEDFYNAMHFGVAPGGRRLYPAFPYPYFTKLTRDDVHAMRAYLDTLPAVKNPQRAPDLPWPLSMRVMMRGWNLLFFDPGTYQPNRQKSAEWNRGAYLVQGAGHCGACHTPKNFLGADKQDQALHGGAIQNWFAPKIAGNMHDGTGAWSVADIVEYLKTGRNAHSGAAGLMAEVVMDSTSKLPKSDLHAMAVYIKDVDGGPAPPAKDEQKGPQMATGKAIFNDSCAACHQADGKGVPRMFPPLAHNANVQQRDPTTVIRVILDGAQTVQTDKQPTASTMPAYGWKLKDGEIAAVATYVRNAWGNSAPPVDPEQVGKLRKTLHESHATGKDGS
jgi:mono/diheme cytochrome c family protein